MKKIKSYQNVVDQIQSAICDGSLKDGDKLPSEMKLTKMFDTSRGTIREALRVLEQKGLISVKTGVKGGPIVKEANTRPMSESIALLIRHQKVSLHHLAQFRKILEGHIAAQTALMAGKNEINQLKAILKEAKMHIKTKPSGWEEFHKMDATFHMALAKIAKNPLIEANLQSIHDNIQIYFNQYLPFSNALLMDNYEDLCKIVEAVENKNSLKARQLAETHVTKFNDLMEERLNA
ncbi:MAG: FadR family transcriptional regulator [Deltaproteobacteria bacterium]|nr:FadR family transcriptional regulator [Deltaproteobacteria bacterium]